MLQKIKAWYQGEHEFAIGGSSIYHKHWTAAFANHLVNFYLEHWKWLIPIVINLAGISIAILKYTGCSQ